MTDNKNVRALASVGLCALVLAACAGYGRVTDHGISTVQFDDIPIPDGLNLRTGANQSHSYTVGRFRYGDFEYSGHPSISETVTYLRERMPHHGWRLTDSDLTDNSSALTFWRQPYEAACRVWKDEGLTRLRVELRTTSPTGSASETASGS